MLGDSTHDLHAGQRAGVGLNIAVLSGPAVIDDLRSASDHVIADIHSLPNILHKFVKYDNVT